MIAIVVVAVGEGDASEIRCKRQGSKGTSIQEDFANPVTRMVLTVGQSAKWKHGVSTGLYPSQQSGCPPLPSTPASPRGDGGGTVGGSCMPGAFRRSASVVGLDRWG
uniref:Uncharacterized protein n=1 Tax=Vespula pensylvanica TaxID=30213 RepID=A0A834NQG0_VESPE|nr:hypothetical protein H0235_012190 [Vespula pensylvanica]